MTRREGFGEWITFGGISWDIMENHGMSSPKPPLTLVFTKNSPALLGALSLWITLRIKVDGGAAACADGGGNWLAF
jgi:hypothetical protein